MRWKTYEHEIDNGFIVRARTEIFMISSRETGADTMMHVHHARHTVKSESIETIFFQVESQVTQQEAQNFV